jgi:hypothetical protein
MCTLAGVPVRKVPLSVSEKLDIKKRVIAALYAMDWEDARMVFDEFGFPPVENFRGTQMPYVRRRVNEGTDDLLSAVDGYIHKDDQPPPISALMDEQENTPFTEPEQKQIAEIIAGVLAEAAEFGLPDDELREVQGALEYAADAVSWIRGRVDWINLAAGVVVNKVAEGILTPDTMHRLFHALGVGLGPLFGHPMPLLPPP